MIEASLLSKLSGLDKYNISSIGNIQLKGKHDGTDVYAIDRLKSWQKFSHALFIGGQKNP